MNYKKEQKVADDRYSDNYIAIRKQAEATWPEWKITLYNTGVAVSAHARKLVKQGK